MTTRTNAVNRRRPLHLLVSMGFIALATAASAACDQPKVRCTATSGEANAKYRLKVDVPNECKGSTLPGLDTSDAADYPMGVEAFVPSPADSNSYQEVNSVSFIPEWIGARIVDARDNATLDPALASQVDELTNYPYGTDKAPEPPPTGPASTAFPYVFGKFDTVNADANNICTVSKMTVSDYKYPAIPAHTYPNPDFDETSPPSDDNPQTLTVDDQPETSIKHEWKNVRVVVSPDSLGTQTFGEMTITQDGCTLTYDVAILYPKVPCEILDADGNGTGKSDVALCDPSPTATNPFGSGISEGIQTTCENLSTDPTAPDFECMPKYMCAGASDCAKYNVTP